MHAPPLSVLFLTYGFSTGGAEMIFVSLLNRIDRSIIAPVIVSLAPPAALEKRLSHGLEVIRFVRRSRFDMAPARELHRLLKERSIHKVLCLGFTSHFFLHKALVGLDTMPEVYISVHTTAPRSLKYAIFGYLSARMIGKDDHLVTVCDSQADYLSERYGIPMEQFHTIHNGVDTSYWTPAPSGFDRAAFRASIGVPQDARVIIKVAAFRKEKKHEDALQALSILRRSTTLPVFLLLVGGGDDKRENMIRRCAREMGIQDAVKFLGPQEDVRPFYWASDLFTLSSVAVETFSMAALEAMSTGLPVILTDIGGAGEMVVNGMNGSTVPPSRPDLLAESWRTVIEQPQRFPAEKIRNHIERRFSIDRCLRSYMELLAGEPLHGTVTSGDRHG